MQFSSADMAKRFYHILTALILCSGTSVLLAAPTDLVGSGAWTALQKGTKFDAPTDTQTNKAGTEVVGDATHASLYFNYDVNGTTSGLDPELDGFLATQFIHFTPMTQLRLVSPSATHASSLNADFNGIGNSATDDWGQTYVALGILSNPVASLDMVDGTAPTISGTYDSTYAVVRLQRSCLS